LAKSIALVPADTGKPWSNDAAKVAFEKGLQAAGKRQGQIGH
jgi:hypothetical protein